MMYNFKEVDADVSSGFEYRYMLNDEEGTVVNMWDLCVEDEEDEKVARYYGLTDEEIDFIRIKTN